MMGITYQDIASAVEAGTSVAQVADHFGVSRTTVYNACREEGIETPGHQNGVRLSTSQRYRRMANMVRDGSSVEEVARIHSVSRNTIYVACHKCGLEFTRGHSSDRKSPIIRAFRMPRQRFFHILAAILNNDTPYREIARKFGVAGRHVSRIAAQLRKAGCLGIPVRRRGRPRN